MKKIKASRSGSESAVDSRQPLGDYHILHNIRCGMCIDFSVKIKELDDLL